MNNLMSNLTVPLLIIVGIISYLFLFESRKEPELPRVIEVSAPATPVEVKPEPFLYRDAVIPVFVPTPKSRPRVRHHRRRILICKPPVVVQ
jgi:hypothetical protein